MHEGRVHVGRGGGEPFMEPRRFGQVPGAQLADAGRCTTQPVPFRTRRSELEQRVAESQPVGGLESRRSRYMASSVCTAVAELVTLASRSAAWLRSARRLPDHCTSTVVTEPISVPPSAPASVNMPVMVAASMDAYRAALLPAADTLMRSQ
jgi:hypothetical protein